MADGGLKFADFIGCDTQFSSEICYPPSDMTLTRNSDKNQFEAVKDGQTAVAQYRLDGDQMTITHIIVPPAIEGQGVGSALAKLAIQTAREESLTIVPQCPFMAAYFRRHPDNDDLLANQ